MVPPGCDWRIWCVTACTNHCCNLQRLPLRFTHIESLPSFPFPSRSALCYSLFQRRKVRSKCCSELCQATLCCAVLSNAKLSPRCVCAFDICCSGILRSCRRPTSSFQSPLRTLIVHAHASTRYAYPLCLLIRHSSCVSISCMYSFVMRLKLSASSHLSVIYFCQDFTGVERCSY